MIRKALLNLVFAVSMTQAGQTFAMSHCGHCDQCECSSCECDQGHHCDQC